MNYHLSQRKLLALWLVLMFVMMQTSLARPALILAGCKLHSLRASSQHVSLDLYLDWEREQLIGIETMVFAALLKDLRGY